MIEIYLADNAPYVVWVALYGDVRMLARRVGEWVYVGRLYTTSAERG